MGVLGLGGIGRAVAQRAKAFAFNVIAVDPEPMEKPVPLMNWDNWIGCRRFYRVAKS